MGNAKSSETTKNLQAESDKISVDTRKRPSLNSQLKKGLLNTSQRQIVKGCLDSAKEDFVDRIYRRVYDKKEEFRIFVCSLPEEFKSDLYSSLREFLPKVVEKLTDAEEVRRLSEDLGAKYLKFRVFGFKNDFFGAIADAVTTECVFLDASVHPTSETLAAWSTLTSTIFSSVRDGYYNEQRKARKIKGSIISNAPSGNANVEEAPISNTLNESFKNDDEIEQPISRSLSPMEPKIKIEAETSDELNDQEVDEITSIERCSNKSSNRSSRSDSGNVMLEEQLQKMTMAHSDSPEITVTETPTKIDSKEPPQPSNSESSKPPDDTDNNTQEELDWTMVPTEKD